MASDLKINFTVTHNTADYDNAIALLDPDEIKALAASIVGPGDLISIADSTITPNDDPGTGFRLHTKWVPGPKLVLAVQNRKLRDGI